MTIANDQIIKFLRRKDFKFIQELGQGACGRTVLLDDPIINERFVCKKYSPILDQYRDKFYKNFLDEIKLLHMLNHPNVVRVFNYYLYPEEKTGYLLMEYVKGQDFDDYLKMHPENINSIFKQVIDGFFHLESNKILHRDIRPANILITDSGEVKIIDFGFGKEVSQESDFDKSISLNWWCEPPLEFKDNIYDHSTEVYFVGKLFEKSIIENETDQFGYKNILTRMIASNQKDRFGNFASLRNEILNDAYSEIEFDYYELTAYRSFADQISGTVTKIEHSAKFNQSPVEIIRKLEDIYKSIMLEESVAANIVVRIFINGTFYFSNKQKIKVDSVKSFLELIRASSISKQNIIIANLHTRLEAIEKYTAPKGSFDDFDDDIPF